MSIRLFAFLFIAASLSVSPLRPIWAADDAYQAGRDWAEVQDEGERIGREAAREGRQIAGEAAETAKQIAEDFKEGYEDAERR